MAKRFVFRLQPVLKLRERREEECRRRVAEQLRRIARVQDELRLIEAGLAAEIGRMREGQRQPTLDALLACRQRGYLAWLDRRRVETGQALGGLEAELSRERAALVQAARDVKALEKLRERQRSRADEAERLMLRRDEDEIAATAFLLAAKVRVG
jgi:flagellar export protein FliJ